MTGSRRQATILFVLIWGLAASCAVSATESLTAVPGDETAALRAELSKRKLELRSLQEQLLDLEARLARVENDASDQRETDSRLSAQVGDADTPSVRGSAGATAVNSIDVDHDNTAVDSHEPLSNREEDRLLRSALEKTLLDRGGLLLPPWRYSIEPSVGYVHSSAENIVVDGFTIFPVLVVGDIVSERVVRDLSLATLTMRLGLPWNAQAEVRIPYGHQKFRSYSADGQEEILNDNALGDIELGFSTQIYKSDGKWPDLEASLRYKTDSGDSPFAAEDGDIFVGTGFDSVNLLLTAVKVADPVVYFGGVDYTLNRSTNESIGKYSPGDSWGFNLGMAIALNLQNSLSFAYDQHFTQYGRLDGVKIPGSYATTGVFSVGSTYAITDTTTIDFSVGIGVTEDSPDLLLSLSLPVSGEF